MGPGVGRIAWVVGHMPMGHCIDGGCGLLYADSERRSAELLYEKLRFYHD